jgi:hypothetical protein
MSTKMMVDGTPMISDYMDRLVLSEIVLRLVG